MTLYVVIAESYLRDDYGSYPKCLGIFDTKEKAEEMREGYETLLREYKFKDDFIFDKEEYIKDLMRYYFNDKEEYIKDLMRYYFKIYEVKLNEKYPLILDAHNWCEVVGGINLGGYAE